MFSATCAQPLQSISMAEERQGEARADPCNLGVAPPAAAGGPYHGGLGGAAAHAQEPNLAGLGGLNPATLAALAAGSLQLPRAGGHIMLRVVRCLPLDLHLHNLTFWYCDNCFVHCPEHALLLYLAINPLHAHACRASCGSASKSACLDDRSSC